MERACEGKGSLNKKNRKNKENILIIRKLKLLRYIMSTEGLENLTLTGDIKRKAKHAKTVSKLLNKNR